MAYASQSKTVNQDPTGQKSSWTEEGEVTFWSLVIHFDRDRS